MDSITFKQLAYINIDSLENLIFDIPDSPQKDLLRQKLKELSNAVNGVVPNDLVPPNPACEYCESTEGVMYDIDPHAHDRYDDDSKHHICPDCYSNKLGDI